MALTKDETNKLEWLKNEVIKINSELKRIEEIREAVKTNAADIQVSNVKMEVLKNEVENMDEKFTLLNTKMDSTITAIDVIKSTLQKLVGGKEWARWVGPIFASALVAFLLFLLNRIIP